MSIFLPIFVFLASGLLLFGQASKESSSIQGSTEEPLPFLTADFFADSLSDAYTLEDDPMGAQRLLQVRNSALTPSVTGSSSFNYTSNPFKQSKSAKTLSKSTSLDLSLTFNLGLGEYGIGDEVVCAPALSFIQMRSFMDPIEDYGTEFSKDPNLNTDTQIASLSLPFVLPNDFSLVLSHTYTAPSTYRGKKQQLMYSNTPKIAFVKNIILDWGDTITISTGASYTFSESDTLEQSIESSLESESSEAFIDFIRKMTEISLRDSGKSFSDYSSNLQNGIGHEIVLSYTKPIGEKLILSPSLVYSSSSFTEGVYKSRMDKSYIFGISASYAYTDWLTLEVSGMQTWKRTSGTIDEDDLLSFDDFTSGLILKVNHAF